MDFVGLVCDQLSLPFSARTSVKDNYKDNLDNFFTHIQFLILQCFVPLSSIISDDCNRLNV